MINIFYFSVIVPIGSNICPPFSQVADDSSILAVGFTNSQIKVFSLYQHKLRPLKSAEDLSDIDHEADDVLYRMIDDTQVLLAVGTTLMSISRTITEVKQH